MAHAVWPFPHPNDMYLWLDLWKGIKMTVVITTICSCKFLTLHCNYFHYNTYWSFLQAFLLIKSNCQVLQAIYTPDSLLYCVCRHTKVLNKVMVFILLCSVPWIGFHVWLCQLMHLTWLWEVYRMWISVLATLTKILLSFSCVDINQYCSNALKNRSW